MIGLSAEIRVYKKLCQMTCGRYLHVIMKFLNQSQTLNYKSETKYLHQAVW